DPTLFSNPPPVTTGEEMVELVCFITGFTPATVEIEWLVDGVSGLLVATQTSPSPEEGANTFSATSRTNVSNVDWLEGKTFTCQVKHPASGTILQDHARFC
uniref:Ig-like domain-containing protein n=1 Tax=Otus sunia TaxID=257818 RepID=A0A8C8B4S9_9STRI